MSKITTHILDTSTGRPAAGVLIMLFQGDNEIARGHTNSDGRLTDFAVSAVPGAYRLRFETRSYFIPRGIQTLYPFIDIHFEVTTDPHYHIPLLLTPWGYSTYRGS